jgi:hypothetical protein
VTDYTDPATAHQRLSDQERDDAVAALRRYAQEGRLSEAELSERSEAARSAVTRGDLAPLFRDLPAETRYGAGNASDPGTGFATPAFGAPDRPAPRGRIWGTGLVAIMPFVSLALFFITGNLAGYQWAWLWFLLIPVTGIMVYGAGYDHRDRR